MIVDEHKNYKQFSNYEEADKYSDLLQIELDKKPLIRFNKTLIIKSFSSLLYKYYIQRNPTYYSTSGAMQCPQFRSRSFIDLYTLQKYYFENPLDLKDLYKIHFNIPRINKTQKESYINNIVFKDRLSKKGNINPTVEEIRAEVDLYLMMEHAKYYCSTVKYNVFVSSNDIDVVNGKYFIDTFKELDEKLKLKNNE